MKYILCYGDSNTWGASPDERVRFEFAERWPGVLQRAVGSEYHIYENGLCGRTTGYQDDVEIGRNGKADFLRVLEMSAPLDLVIIMLGSNDCKRRFVNHPAWDSALNIQQLVKMAATPLYGQGAAAPQVLIVAPAKLGSDWETSWVGEEFDRFSTQKSEELAAFYSRIAHETGAYFLDASEFVASGSDSVHLNAIAHERLGKAIAERVREIFKETKSV